MKTGTIIAGVGLTAGLAALGYYGYKQFATPAAPAAGSLIPAGNNPSTGAQQYINNAGEIVDKVGNIINTLKKVDKPGPTLTDSYGSTFALSTETERGGYKLLVNGKHDGGGISLVPIDGKIYSENNKQEKYLWNNATKRWDRVPAIPSLSGLRGLGSLAVANMMG